ncbi:hypothetical protein GV827_22470 [Sulfitobacter sp. JBTF-M27]|uniref:Uncharacterized protein n=1 Tax=Sulfitobacter sediminilitoris TaxID=2698830 RepID=A0A6P0CKY0_9RHOB|nr:hypothetical protein [Sulfitobacter sediminilitoris]NEK25134.1 hypothetical protein [Sulfitobacter sediminilitoris]
MTMLAVREYSKVSQGEMRASFPDSHEQFASRGFLVPSRSLFATCGAAGGETLVTPEDFIVGDAIRLIDCATNIPVEFKDHVDGKFRIDLGEADIGLANLELQLSKSITLMSEFGATVHASILLDQRKRHDHAFLLLEKQFTPATDYTILAQQVSVDMSA